MKRAMKRATLLRNGSLASIAVCVLAGSAHAAILTEDFQDDTVGQEPDDASFIVGTSASGASATVVDSSSSTPDPFGGTGNQSLRTQDTEDADLARIGYDFDTVNSDGATASVDVFLDGDGSETAPGALIRTRTQNNADAAYIRFQDAANGTATVVLFSDSVLVADQSFSVDQTLPVALTHDFTNDTYSVKIDGTQITDGTQSDFAFADGALDGTDGIERFEVLNYRANKSGSQVFFDNLSVAVPEPTSLALLGLGGVMMLNTRRRRA